MQYTVTFRATGTTDVPSITTSTGFELRINLTEFSIAAQCDWVDYGLLCLSAKVFGNFFFFMDMWQTDHVPFVAGLKQNVVVRW